MIYKNTTINIYLYIYCLWKLLKKILLEFLINNRSKERNKASQKSVVFECLK